MANYYETSDGDKVTFVRIPLFDGPLPQYSHVPVTEFVYKQECLACIFPEERHRHTCLTKT